VKIKEDLKKNEENVENQFNFLDHVTGEIFVYALYLISIPICICIVKWNYIIIITVDNLAKHMPNTSQSTKLTNKITAKS
jgi:hypothetical protein